MNKETNETVNITTKTAWAALELMHDMLEWVEFLDDETRRQIIALDELVKALDAESFITGKRDEVITQRQKEWQEKQAEIKNQDEAVN